MTANLRLRLLVLLLVPLMLLAAMGGWFSYSAADEASTQHDQRLLRLLPALADSVLAPSIADDNGLASSHTLRKEGGKTCFADHLHSGSGDGATKEAARAVAAREWSSFVDFEYGSDWARFSKAAAITTRYTKAEKGWTAWIEGRPCK